MPLNSPILDSTPGKIDYLVPGWKTAASGTYQDNLVNYLKFNPPLPEGLIEEVTQFWEEIFASSYEGFMHQLGGAESGDNYNCVYLVREGERLLGTCCLTISRTLPQLGGLGEVATRPQYRRRGIAALLCEQACNDFRRQLGQALFLGTVNPEAARVYHRLGWRKLAGANVMALIARGGSPEAFLVDYFSEEAAAITVPGGGAHRIPMIPLILCPHDWQVLDANVEIHSTRYATQSSCMGLYPRYQAMDRDGRGAWFAARTGTGRVVGLSSARLGESGSCQVDGFTHWNYEAAWNELIEAAAGWGREHQATALRATLSIEDEDKVSRFEALGFHPVGAGPAFTLEDRQVASVRLERALDNEKEK